MKALKKHSIRLLFLLLFIGITVSCGDTDDGGATPTPTIPVAASFTASLTSIEVGASVNFTSTSTGSPTSFSWTFEGGTPASSTDANPSVTYNTTGTFEVSLTGSNGTSSDTETRAAFISVSEVAATVTADKSHVRIKSV